MSDAQVAYGTRCTWWGPVSDAHLTGRGLPICPHCAGPLIEADNEVAFLAFCYDAQDQIGVDDYVELIRWCRGRCHPSIDEARHIRATAAVDT